MAYGMLKSLAEVNWRSTPCQSKTSLALTEDLPMPRPTSS